MKLLSPFFSIVIILVALGGCEAGNSPIPNDDQLNGEIVGSDELDSLELMNDDDMIKIPIKFLALGDSYTIGESVDEADRWPNQLAKTLVDSNIEIIKPDIIARTGWTTNELQSAINASDFVNQYDLVSLLIGVNNQYRGYPQAQQRKEFEELLIRAIAFAQGDTSRVFVVSIPDYGVTPFGQSGDPEKIANEIDAYNLINQTICETYNVRYFDITPISRLALNQPELIAKDKLHPSGEMYRLWVELITPNVLKMLTD